MQISKTDLKNFLNNTLHADEFLKRTKQGHKLPLSVFNLKKINIMKKSFVLFILASILFGIGCEANIPIIIGMAVIACILIVVRELIAAGLTQNL